MPPKLGCIADDFTGGTDLAGMLVKHGMRTVQMIGIPEAPPPDDVNTDDVDAIVIALKSRTSLAADAVRESLAALDWLRRAGCRQYFFKYCSTFDSTPQGNIGPVAEALMAAVGSDFTIACPAFPANQRTVYHGHLFVGDVLLSESGMRHHPLTPMTDANLVRVLQVQAKGKVGLVDYRTVRQGSRAVRDRIALLRRQGVALAVIDAVEDTDLAVIGAACADLPLITGGSGLAVGLPATFDLAHDRESAAALPATGGMRAVIAGSCSTATQGQVAIMRRHHPSFQVNPRDLASGQDVAARALAWAAPLLSQGPVLIFATAAADDVKAVQAALGPARAGALVEETLAAIARGLVELGVGQMIVAGGETSGAVVKALGVGGLRIGPEIDPGVPWTTTIDRAVSPSPDAAPPLALALKSGNFGTSDFFLKAWDHLS